MEFHIKTRGISLDLAAINDALTGVDPSAMADIDPGDASLRVAGRAADDVAPHGLIALAPKAPRSHRLHWTTGSRRERASWIMWKPCVRQSVRRRY